MKLAIVLACSAVFCGSVIAHPVRYDQRQEGDLNVRTDVEDVVFVMVPPQDLVTAGMGLVAATAADLLRKNYGPIGPERWPLRTPTKVGFIPLEKSPYKVDLEKSGLKVKKIAHAGDPNRFNFHDSRTPTKVSPDMKAEVPEKPVLEIMTEAVEEMPSTTESKTVKKVLKPEDLKKTPMEEEKKKDKLTPEVGAKAEETKVKTPEKVAEETRTKMPEKTEDARSKIPEKKAEETKAKISQKVTEETKIKSAEKEAGESLKIIGEGLDPDSIFRIEGCGPDARRDSSGKCVFKN